MNNRDWKDQHHFDRAAVLREHRVSTDPQRPANQHPVPGRLLAASKLRAR